jgi:uncharacterized protein (TIGR02145 family)
MSSVTILLSSVNYTSNRPSFDSTGNYANNLYFASKSLIYQLSLTNYSFGSFTISLTAPTINNYLVISFVDADDESTYVSVSDNQNGLYLPSSGSAPAIFAVLTNGIGSTTKQLFVIVNSNSGAVTKNLKINVAIGAPTIPTATTGFSVVSVCPGPANVYQATVGLHAYSPYDAIAGSSRLSTILYSLTPSVSWGINTVVYSSPMLNNPAMPYYYGLGTHVFKVGGELNRAYGIQRQIRAVPRLFHRTTVSQVTVGPRDYTTTVSSNVFNSPACVFPVISKLGLITESFLTTSLYQPLQYRYYVGYNLTSQQNSNDSTFVKYCFSYAKGLPVTGFLHAVDKIGYAIMAGLNTTNDLTALSPMGFSTIWGMSPLGFIAAVAGVSLVLWAIVCVLSGITVQIGAAIIIDGGAGPLIPLLADFIEWVGFVGEVPILAIIAAIAIVLITLFKLIKAFSVHYYSEGCTNYLHHFTTTPYINLGSSILYRDSLMTTHNDGYYCDGVYFYNQVGASITQKLLSSTIAFLGEPPVTMSSGPVNSVQADFGTYANPNLITDFYKLLLLNYTSGKPLPGCGGNPIYYNIAMAQTITGTNCDLETSTTETITVAAGTFFDCVNQTNANNRATALLTSSVAQAQALNGAGISTTSIPDSNIGRLDISFTHVLKVEGTPTQNSIYYNNTDGLGVTVGKFLYYDYCGCTKVLNGYYAITGVTYYRTFYQTTNGAIVNIYYMLTSSSTTTTTSQPIIPDDGFTSDWYLESFDENTLQIWVNKIINNRFYNTTTMASDTSIVLKRGFLSTPTTPNNFQLYTTFPSYSEAPTGWYTPLTDWIGQSYFFYNRAISITLNITEICNDITNTRGFKILPFLGSTQVATPDFLNLTFLVTYAQIGNSTTGSTTYNVTTSSDYSTTVNYNNAFPYTYTVTNIRSITAFPIIINKTTYSLGTVTYCTSIIPSPTPSVTPTITPSLTAPVPSPTPTPLITPSVTPPVVPNYGYLYNYYSLANLPATGWHVPTDAEWATLVNTLTTDSSFDGGVINSYESLSAGGSLKETGIVHWESPNVGATNLSGFNGRGGGFRDGGGNNLGIFGQMDFSASYATKTVSVENSAGYYYRSIFAKGMYVYRNFAYKQYGFSVRLVKNITGVTPSGYVGNDGTTYGSIIIGTQEWMSENLRETLYNTSATIPNVSSSNSWKSLSSGALCIYT